MSVLGIGVGLEGELKIVLKHGVNPQKIAILILRTDFGYEFYTCQVDKVWGRHTSYSSSREMGRF